MSQIQDLETENTKLKAQLAVAKKWMAAQVDEDLHDIVSHHTLCEERTTTVDEVSEQIYHFLDDIVLASIPNGVVKHLVSAEIEYQHLKHDPNFDGLGVMSSYHKALDILIETYITQGFRRFMRDIRDIHTSSHHDALERSLHLVVTQKYILSIGRLYHILERMQSSDTLSFYTGNFIRYIRENHDIGDVVTGDGFLSSLGKCVESELLSRKRHEDMISLEELSAIRSHIVGDLTDKQSLVYQLLSIGTVKI